MLGNPETEVTKPHGIVYCALNKVNGKRYIGQTTKALDYRKSKHFVQAKAGKRMYRFQNALSKYGPEGFDFQEIDAAFSADELNDMEDYWVRFYDATSPDCGYNSRLPGDHDYAAISRSNRGRVPHNKGKKVSPELREKLLANFGKNRNTFKSGHDIPDEWRKSWSEKRKGMHNAPQTEFPKTRVQCVETGEIFETVASASKHLGLSSSNFSRLIRKPDTLIGGFHWKRL